MLSSNKDGCEVWVDPDTGKSRAEGDIWMKLLEVTGGNGVP